MLSFFGQNRSCAAGVCFVEARYVNVGRDFNVSSFVWMHNMFVIHKFCSPWQHTHASSGSLCNFMMTTMKRTVRKNMNELMWGAFGMIDAPES